jgi:hypothetical protein
VFVVGFSPCTSMGLQAHPDHRHVEVKNPLVNLKKTKTEENSAAIMQRLAEEMRFRIMEATAQRGGSETFLHWLRSDAVKKA